MYWLMLKPASSWQIVKLALVWVQLASFEAYAMRLSVHEWKEAPVGQNGIQQEVSITP